MQTLKSFEYFEPATVKEAVQILSKYGTNAKVLAGGCDLVPGMRQRKIKPECVISLGNIPGLDYIKGDSAKGLSIGPMTKIRSLELSPVIKKNYVALYEAVHSIASIQVKTTGTVIGNLCVATPASDIAPALAVFGAELKIAGPSSKRTVPIEDFCVGVKQCALQPGEIVAELVIPPLPTGAVSAFLKLARTAADIAKVNVAVMLRVSNYTCREAKIALGSVAPTPIRAKKAEEALKGKKIDQRVIEAAAQAAAEEATPITDIRSTAEYRKETTRVLVRRVIEKAVERAKG